MRSLSGLQRGKPVKNFEDVFTQLERKGAMDSRKTPSETRTEAAAKLNQSLAVRVARWKRLRLSLTVVMTVCGIALFLVRGASFFAVPCLIAAFIAYLLYLDARDELREVRSRSWVSVTPRIGKLISHSQQERASGSPARE